MAVAENNWNDWLEEYGGRMLLLAKQYVINFSDAEEIVQEAFIRFWRNKYFEKENAIAYLYRCVRSAAIDWVRSSTRRKAREKKVGEEQGYETMFECEIENSERAKHIARAMSELPENQREVVVMKIWGGLTFEKISEVLETPKNTVASRYRYALQAMKSQIDREVIYD